MLALFTSTTAAFTAPPRMDMNLASSYKERWAGTAPSGTTPPAVSVSNEAISILDKEVPDSACVTIFDAKVNAAASPKTERTLIKPFR